MKVIKPEILAPAGNVESLRAAVINGADAVYLGASLFSARAKAGNFTIEELSSAIEYCHLFSVKVYLAVNTLIKPSEYSQAIELIKTAKSMHIDAIIVQDLAFLEYLHSTIPDITLHFSTQMGIHNLEGALVAEKLGASRIILSREVTLQDVEKICKNTSLEVEVFVHGALCIAFSGNCYFSSLATGLSGNRGKCLQLCRKKYRINNYNGYLLSPKDLDLSSKIQKLSELGVASIKIEGRMKRPEYVAEAVKYYRDILDGKSADNTNLKKLFNRGDGGLGYIENATAPVVYPKAQGHIGVKVGSVKKLVGKKAILSLSNSLKKGDGIKFIRNGYEVGSASVFATGNEVSYLGKIQPGDEVRLTTDAELIEQISKRKRSLPISIELSGSVSEQLSAKATCGETEVALKSDFVLQDAISAPLCKDDFLRAFKKVDDNPFEITNFVFNCEDKVFCKVSDLNAFRRALYSLLRKRIVENYDKTYRPNVEKTQFEFGFKKLSNKPKTIIQVDDLGAISLLNNDTTAVAFFPKEYDEKSAELFRACPYDKFLTLPIILRTGDVEKIRAFIKTAKVEKVIVNNISHLEIAKDCEVLFGVGMNIINPDFAVDKIMSFEYDGKKYNDNYVYAYGYAPLMTFAHCPKKTVNGNNCINCNLEDLCINDENGNRFKIRFYRVKHCYSQLLNSVPINVIKKANDINARYHFIDLIGVDREECEKTLDNYFNGASFVGAFTGGFFNKKLD